MYFIEKQFLTVLVNIKSTTIQYLITKSFKYILDLNSERFTIDIYRTVYVRIIHYISDYLYANWFVRLFTTMDWKVPIAVADK